MSDEDRSQGLSHSHRSDKSDRRSHNSHSAHRDDNELKDDHHRHSRSTQSHWSEHHHYHDIDDKNDREDRRRESHRQGHSDIHHDHHRTHHRHSSSKNDDNNKDNRNREYSSSRHSNERIERMSHYERRPRSRPRSRSYSHPRSRSGSPTKISSKSQEPASPPSKLVVEESEEDGDWVIAEDTGNFYANEKNLVYKQEEKSSGDDLNSSEPIASVPTTAAEKAPSRIIETTVSVDELNKLKAAILKAELRGDSEKIETLKTEYEKLVPIDASSTDDGVSKSNIKVIDSRFVVKPGSSANTDPSDPTIQDMIREELSTRNEQLDSKFAEQISKDGGYNNDLDYIADNAEKLAQISQKSDHNRRNQMIENTRRMNEAISSCKLCLEEGSGTTIIAIATQVYLCIAPEPAVVKGTVAIVPMDHYKNTLECNDDEWEEIRNFMKSLTKMWAKSRRGVLFYENAVSRSGHMHASIFAVPIPFHLLESAPGFFTEAIMATDDEWSSHRKIIDTRKPTDATMSVDPKYLFRTSIAKEAPYFHVWFNINGGIGHIVENSSRWPRGDRFAREVIGGMLQVDSILIHKSSHWNKNAVDREYLDNMWREFDWTVEIPPS